MKVKDFDYHLPVELIAQKPADERASSRMLVMRRENGACKIHDFTAIPDFLYPGDCLVLNDTQVIPARLFGRRNESGGRMEVLMCEELSPGRWRALLKPSRRIKPLDKIIVEKSPAAVLTVVRRLDDSSFEINTDHDNVHELLSQCGEIPLPPYIRRTADEADTARYQTVYARHPGAVAAPTAGLHFNREILQTLSSRQVAIASLTLHVGPGTFRPVTVDRIEDHRMHEERYCLSPESAALINQTKARHGRVIAVGTTTVRVLETCVDDDGLVQPGQGKTTLFMHPPMQPRAVDGLLTNFHLPRSTLIMLVATFTGREPLLAAYRMAVEQRLRFYSYGDCMLII